MKYEMRTQTFRYAHTTISNDAIIKDVIVMVKNKNKPLIMEEGSSSSEVEYEVRQYVCGDTDTTATVGEMIAKLDAEGAYKKIKIYVKKNSKADVEFAKGGVFMAVEKE
jgi:Ser-tRNA(Ala) deacylase AlaX